jgi:outer membrane protein TolC
MQILDSVRFASYVYWSWVAAGQAYMVTRELLTVAQDRNRAIARQVELGNLAATELQQNERLIASRQAKLIETQRKLQSAAIKLSLFWRDDNGDPVVPTPAQLPARFPEPREPNTDRVDEYMEVALNQRPELQDLALHREAANIDLTQGQNETLPRLDAVVEASKDVGGWASSKGDKTPFEMEAGLLFDVPLQRRKAIGKIESAQGKLTQISLKQRYTENKIRAEVADALSALKGAYKRVQRTREGVQLARQLVNAEYRSFELGNSDVLRIALQEGAELDSQLLEIEALLDYFQATAEYRYAIGESLPLP